MIRLGHPIQRFAAISSTMDALDRLARNGASEGTAVVSDLQEQGRGRSGRSWQAAPGTALLCSVLLRPELETSQISSFPLVAGVAIAEAIEEVAGLGCQLKWPNDVFLNGKKVCGILIQSRSRGKQVEFVNLGFGINVNSRSSELPETATSLAIEAERGFDLAGFEQVVFARLSTHYAQWLAAGGRPSLEPWLRRALFLGEEITIQQEGRLVTGRLIGINADGSLKLETKNGEVSVAIGELTRGPRTLAATESRD